MTTHKWEFTPRFKRNGFGWKSDLHMCRIKEALIEIRKVAKKYSQKSATEILNDLIKSQPGSEGKWFAAAKDAELFEQAIELARRSPTDPRTHTRAARDYARLCRNNVE